MVREGLGLTQAQMAGFLGLNRSYVAELETGRRPVADWISRKAAEVERTMRGVNLIKNKPISGQSGDGFDEFEAALQELTGDEIGQLTDHFVEMIESAPKASLLFYEPALKATLSEVRRRLIIYGRGKSKTREEKK